MTRIEYIRNYTTKWAGVDSIYTCNITGLSFSWEDSDMHFNYLKRKNLIE